jgi:recombination DNA repair RAD52 pathway protein
VTFTPEQIAALDAPLAKSAVKERTQAGRALSYVEGWHVIAEANRIFGFDGWTRETTETRLVAEAARKIGKEFDRNGNPQPQKDGWGVSYIARVRVVIFAGDTIVTREGIGSGHGIDVDLGLAHESAIKESETDAMKRALMTFGNPFGLALYDKTQENVERAPPPAKAAPVRVAPNGADAAAAKMVDQINMAVTVEALESTKALIRPDFLRLPREQQKHVASAAEAKALALEAA